ncbi:hypothetical protein ACA910_005046 [Epithemia clementina (nom. ined.)]
MEESSNKTKQNPVIQGGSGEKAKRPPPHQQPPNPASVRSEPGSTRSSIQSSSTSVQNGLNSERQSRSQASFAQKPKPSQEQQQQQQRPPSQRPSQPKQRQESQSQMQRVPSQSQMQRAPSQSQLQRAPAQQSASPQSLQRGPPQQQQLAAVLPTKDVEFNPTSSTSHGSRPGMDSVSSFNGAARSQLQLNTREEWVEINDDVYNMFFLSKAFGQAFWYAIYIFILKLTLYTFLGLDALDIPQPDDTSTQVLVTQFFMLPVAVAMQDDLIATFFLVANIKYSPLIKMQNPHATKWKFHVASICRGLDGMYSLFVNFIILLTATEVLSLFLNFAALQFLQNIDNIALRLCADGYLSERLEEVANNVMSTKLPNKHNKVYRSMDSILFISTYTALLIAWALVSFG